MARTDTLTNFLTDVAAAIKAKKGDDTAIPAANFDTEITNLSSGGGEGSGDNTTLINLIDRTVTSFEIPEGTTSIGKYAFYNFSGLTSITIPDSVTSIGDSAFDGCTGLTSITIPDSVISIETNAFHRCNGLTSAIIGNGVTSIGINAFYSCTELTNVTIGNSVTSIESSAFYGCLGLTSITIPNSVTSVGNSAFYNCTGLTEIDFSTHTTIPTLYSTTAFDNTSASLVIKVPSALLDEWKAATNWSTYADKIVGVRL